MTIQVRAKAKVGVLEALAAALSMPLPPTSDFDLNPEFRPTNPRLQHAAVLVAVLEAQTEPQVILTRRALGLPTHAGQIALPGGRVEPQDRSVETAALREAWEEIALDPASVELLGRLPPHQTVSGFVVTPVVGVVPADKAQGFCPRPRVGEVEEVFFVPLAHVADPQRYRVERRRWKGHWRSYWVVPWGPYYIWGATARVLRTLAEALR